MYVKSFFYNRCDIRMVHYNIGLKTTNKMAAMTITSSQSLAHEAYQVLPGLVVTFINSDH